MIAKSLDEEIDELLARMEQTDPYDSRKLAIKDLIQQQADKARIDEVINLISHPELPTLLTPEGYLYHQKRLAQLKGEKE